MLAVIPRLRRFLSILTCFALAGLVALSACSQPAKSAIPPDGQLPCEAQISVVDAEHADKTLSFSGVTEPVRRAMPATRLMAKVVQANFVEGDRVSANQVLIRLDVSDLEAKRRQVLSAADAAQMAYRIAEANLRRMQDLASSGSVTQTNLEQMQIAHAQASTALVTTNSALAELDTNLAYATIRTPFAGTIVQRLVEVGNMVGPGQPLFIVEDDSRLRVVATIGTDAASLMSAGQQVVVRIDGETITGEVEAVVSSGDSRAPGFRVNILIDNPTRHYKSGLLATVEATLGASESLRVRVPRNAVVTRGALAGVYVVDADNTARLRWLVVESIDAETYSVITGINEGERIVLVPDAACLVDGRRVVEVKQ